ncbi:MAG: hypothetical protein E7200_09460 [Selenomonas ruminantium]|nr:hypothetical protein [Selenomonas ruminantium]
MEYDVNNEITRLIEENSSKYHIDKELYDVCTAENIEYFDKHPKDRGACATNKETGRCIILMNRKLLLTLSELEYTFLHEFRHVWQRNNKEKYNIEYWIGWNKRNKERYLEGAYFFSPTELDANRFAGSDGTLNDYTVFQSCLPCEKIGEELRRNQEFVLKLMNSEEIYIIPPNVALNLLEKKMIDSQLYAKWRHVYKEKNKLCKDDV